MRSRRRLNLILGAVLAAFLLLQIAIVLHSEENKHSHHHTSPFGPEKALVISPQKKGSILKVNSEDSHRRYTREELNHAILHAVGAGTADPTVHHLPSWMNEYLDWHKIERSKLSMDSLNNTRILVMRCLSCDARCGGSADRLVTISFMLYLAHQTKRLLFIYWERPASIEHFLVPSKIDWVLPEYLKASLQKECTSEKFFGTEEELVSAATSNTTIISARFQSASYGSDYYESERKKRDSSEPSFDDAFGAIWRATFRPSAGLLRVIQDTAAELHLFPLQYSAVHLRGLYNVKDRSKALLEDWARNGVNCGSQIKPGGPIYFASDSKISNDFALAYGTFRSTRSVVVRNSTEAPLHLDKHNSSSTSPESFYDTFVDLYLLGLSHCVAYSRGGFGRWGALLTNNHSCSFRFMYNAKRKVRCRWNG